MAKKGTFLPQNNIADFFFFFKIFIDFVEIFWLLAFELLAFEKANRSKLNKDNSLIPSREDTKNRIHLSLHINLSIIKFLNKIGKLSCIL